MDAELREYLESFRLEMLGRFSQVDARFDQVDARFIQVDDRFDQVDARFGQMDDRFGQVDARITEEIAALREEMVVGHEALHKEIRGVDRGLRLLIEDVRKDIRAVLDGVATANEKLDRRLEEYKHDTDNRTGLVEAVVQRHSGQIQDHDRRITVLEEQGGR